VRERKREREDGRVELGKEELDISGRRKRGV